jgi:hypothetical protein
MEPTILIEGKAPAYWQAELSDSAIGPKDMSFTLRMYINDPELIKKINSGSLIGLSIGKGFQEARTRVTLRDRVVHLLQDIGFRLEMWGTWLQDVG